MKNRTRRKDQEHDYKQIKENNIGSLRSYIPLRSHRRRNFARPTQNSLQYCKVYYDNKKKSKYMFKLTY